MLLDVAIYECGPSKPAGPRIGFNIAKWQFSSIQDFLYEKSQIIFCLICQIVFINPI
jgi:hypothetical protein